jgi:hypothetical protein
MSAIDMDAILAMIFQTIQDRLATIKKAGNVNQLRFIDQDLGQLEIDEIGTKESPVAFPCSLIDLVDLRYTDNSRNSQQGEGILEVRLGLTAYAAATHYYQNPAHKTNALEYFNVEHRVNKALHGWSDDRFFTPLSRVGATTEKRKDNVRVRVLRYAFGFVDNTAMEVRTATVRPDIELDITD